MERFQIGSAEHNACKKEVDGGKTLLLPDMSLQCFFSTDQVSGGPGQSMDDALLVEFLHIASNGRCFAVVVLIFWQLSAQSWQFLPHLLLIVSEHGAAFYPKFGSPGKIKHHLAVSSKVSFFALHIFFGKIMF